MTKRDDSGRLTDYGKLHKEAPDFLALDEILRREVLITGATFHDGEYGHYCVMTVILDDEEVKVRTGASLVVDALEDAVANDALPLAARFVQRGRTFRFE